MYYTYFIYVFYLFFLNLTYHSISPCISHYFSTYFITIPCLLLPMFLPHSDGQDLKSMPDYMNVMFLFK